jgi:acetyl-CoA acetyltransferase
MNAQLGSGAAIVSLGYHLVSSKLGDERISAVELQVRAACKAMQAAGVTPRDIGAFFTGRPPVEDLAPQWNMTMVDALKLTPRVCTSVTNHGAGHLSALRYAAWSVMAGAAELALVTSGSNASLWLDSMQTTSVFECDPQFEGCYEPTTPSIYAQIASRYIHEHGITAEQAARVAVEHRKWGVRHPLAVAWQKPLLTVDDVLASRMIASPFRLLDCASWYPGGTGVAVVVASAERARQMTPNPVYIAGFGECVTNESVTERLTAGAFGAELRSVSESGASVAAAQAFAMAGWSPSDVDLVQTQSPFTYMILMALEDLGFCAKGEGGRFVECGGIDFDGGLPVNTSGGMLSFGQPMNTNSLLIEAYEQLQGQALGKQVPDAHRALVHFHGGPFSCHSVALLSTEPPQP